MNDDEIITFEKPFKLNGYEVKDTKELRELYEYDVITLEKYDKTLEQIKNGEIGIMKKRKHYKELYEEDERMLYSLRQQIFAYARAINEIEELTEDKQVLELIAKLRKKRENDYAT